MAVFIVDAVQGLTVDLQTVLRGLEDIFEGSVLVLVEASAAGFLLILGSLAVYDNGLLAAAAVAVVKTIGYCTFQIGHNKCIPPMIVVRSAAVRTSRTVALRSQLVCIDDSENIRLPKNSISIS